MRVVFADTSYWIAILNPRDELHQKATEVSQALKNTRIVTSEMVLTELLNDFASRGEQLRLTALKLIERMKQDPNTEIMPQTHLLFEEALDFYSQRK